MSRICVIFNPSAGRRRAARRLAAFREQWEGCVDFLPTRSAGHATQLAREAVRQGFQVIGAAGGDGTVHEVVSGLMEAGMADVTFAVVPIGSANDFAYSVEKQFGLCELDDEASFPVDVGLLRMADGRGRHFIESLGIGLTGEITAESRLIPDRQGLCLYGTAAFRVLWRRQPAIPMTLTWDDEPPIQTKTRLLSVLLGQREGNFLMAKEALLDDGQFDIVHGGDVSHWEALRLLPRFLLSGPPGNHPQITRRQCRRLTVKSTRPLAIHTDGELVATTTDDVRELTIENLPSRLHVKVCPL